MNCNARSLPFVLRLMLAATLPLAHVFGAASQGADEAALLPVFSVDQQVPAGASGASARSCSHSIVVVGRDFEATFHGGYAFYAGGQVSDKPWRYDLEDVHVGSTRYDLACRHEPDVESYACTYDHGPVLERYDVRRDGVEQSFVVSERPRHIDGDLVVTGRVRSDLSAENVSFSHRELEFRDADDRVRMRYGRAFAIDAAGRRDDVETSFEDGRLRLRVRQAWLEDASWPVTIDPLTQPVAVWPVTARPGTTVRVALATQDRSKSKNVLIAFTTDRFVFQNPPITEVRTRVLLANDDFSNAILVGDFEDRWLDRGMVAAVEGAGKWVVAMHRAQSPKGIELYVHDFHSKVQGSGSSITLGGFPGPWIYPGVGGCREGNLALVAYLDEQGTLSAREIDVQTLTMGPPIFLGLISPGAISVTPLRRCAKDSWLVAWTRIDANDPPYVQVSKVWVNRVRGGAASSATFVGYGLGPRIAGMDGEALVAFEATKTPYGNTYDIATRRVSWPGTIPWPSFGTLELTPATHYQNVLDVDFDATSSSHWAVLRYRQNVGAYYQIRTLDGSVIQGGDGVLAGSVRFSERSGEYLVAGYGAQRIQGQRLSYDASFSSYGAACTTASIGALHAPARGTVGYAVTLDGADAASAILALGTRSTREPMAGTACWTLVGGAVQYFPASIDARGHAEARFELPVELRGSLHTQWSFAVRGMRGSVVTTSGLELRLE
ncbi:MAG: hypothetical protein KDC95_07900 [Planctomycetes bacterium]|nr:hypothetical protein [Planctomycetota bacterium]